MFKGVFTAIKRFFMYLGVLAERASETDAINEAIVDRGIRDSKIRADSAHKANGGLQATIIMLKDQIRTGEFQMTQLRSELDLALATNDEIRGADVAERLADKEQDVNTNKEQLSKLQEQYKMNTEIIAQSLRDIQKFERDFQATKARVAVSRNLEQLAGLMKSSITELQGMIGSEMSSAMQRMKQSAAQGEGQMQATLDLAKEMGSNIKMEQESRRARGKMLFEQYKQKNASNVQVDEKENTAVPAREKIGI